LTEAEPEVLRQQAAAQSLRKPRTRGFFVRAVSRGVGGNASTSASGHHLPLAVAFEFLTLSESKWPLYGAEVGGGFGSTCH